MGRTNPTFRRVIQRIRREWSEYQRALRREDQTHFDAVFDKAEQHADAAGYVNPDRPMDAIWLSIVLEQEKEIAQLQQEVGVDGGLEG